MMVMMMIWRREETYNGVNSRVGVKDTEFIEKLKIYTAM
jgi:hypothetical protein